MKHSEFRDEVLEEAAAIAFQYSELVEGAEKIAQAIRTAKSPDLRGDIGKCVVIGDDKAGRINAEQLPDALHGFTEEERKAASWAMASSTLARVTRLRDANGEFFWKRDMPMVPVKDRLPEPSQQVIIYDDATPLVAIDQLTDSGEWAKSTDRIITHWAPLPSSNGFGQLFSMPIVIVETVPAGRIFLTSKPELVEAWGDQVPWYAMVYNDGWR